MVSIVLSYRIPQNLQPVLEQKSKVEAALKFGSFTYTVPGSSPPEVITYDGQDQQVIDFLGIVKVGDSTVFTTAPLGEVFGFFTRTLSFQSTTSFTDQYPTLDMQKAAVSELFTGRLQADLISPVTAVAPHLI
jgi:hypothetical protein